MAHSEYRVLIYAGAGGQDNHRIRSILGPAHDITGIEPSPTGARRRSEWRQHTATVCSRHRRTCDIQIIIAGAVGQMPEFQVRSVDESRLGLGVLRTRV
jgi:hypothetical protein